MYPGMILRDLRKNRMVSLVTTIFIASAAALISISATLVVQLSGSIDAMMAQAMAPHFMQMHSGEVDSRRLDDFVAANGMVEAYQAREFLNIEGSRIALGGKTLAASIQDNGLSTQGDGLDYLLDLNGKIIRPMDGEVYVPLAYRKDGTAMAGDTARIGDRDFVIAGFLRDSIMNSPLASSKRFLVSPGDYASLAPQGKLEYLIEFRLKNPKDLASFGAAYAVAGLEANGPTVTYPLFRMMNALSDGPMIAVILLVSLLVVAIALLCVRFTLLARIEDDRRQIGVMKAIGLRLSDIKGIYLGTYAAMAAAGCVLGLTLSIPLQAPLMEGIRETMGEGGASVQAAFLAFAGVTAVFLAVIAYVRKVLRRFGRLSAAEALRTGASQEGRLGKLGLGLRGGSPWKANASLGFKDVLARKGLYITMLLVLVLASFIMVVPDNLSTTIGARSFCRYLGIGLCDIRIDIQQLGDIDGLAALIDRGLGSDPDIAKVALLTTKSLRTRMDGGDEAILKVEQGDHEAFPVAYAQGGPPVAADDLALSGINAQDLRKGLGDRIILDGPSGTKDYRICGIYSDVTNGGKTAKAAFVDPKARTLWAVLCATAAPGAGAAALIERYAVSYPSAKISGIDRYVAQTFGATIAAIRKAALAAIIVALFLSALVTFLFIRMLVAKDSLSTATLKALGFSDRDIMTQYLVRSGVVLVLGILLGTILANTSGEALARLVISSFGAASFSFEIAPLKTFILFPAALAASVTVATALATRSVPGIRIAQHVKE